MNGPRRHTADRPQEEQENKVTDSRPSKMAAHHPTDTAGMTCKRFHAVADEILVVLGPLFSSRRTAILAARSISHAAQQRSNAVTSALIKRQSHLLSHTHARYRHTHAHRVRLMNARGTTHSWHVRTFYEKSENATRPSLMLSPALPGDYWLRQLIGRL